MANQEQLKIFYKGVDHWNKWRADNPDVKIDLSGATLSDPLPKWAFREIVKIDLSSVDLSKANLKHSIIRWADLSHANFSNTDLSGADLRKSRLNWADLTNSNLSCVNFTLSSLRDAVVSNALLWETVFARTELRDVRDLEKCRHGGPCIVDHRTVRKSPGVSDIFWLRCGIPIEILKSLQTVISFQSKMPSCFISYSTKDSELADMLYNDLQKHNVDCWMAEHDLRGGDILINQIETAIEEHERVLLLLSQSSINSNWVVTEILNARARERTEANQVLFPIRLIPFSELQAWKCFDSDSGEDLAKIVRNFFIPDFSCWKDRNQYKEAFFRLLQDLEKCHRNQKKHYNRMQRMRKRTAKA